MNKPNPTHTRTATRLHEKLIKCNSRSATDLSQLLADSVSRRVPLQGLAPRLLLQQQVSRHPRGVGGGLEAGALVGRFEAKGFQVAGPLIVCRRRRWKCVNSRTPPPSRSRPRREGRGEGRGTRRPTAREIELFALFVLCSQENKNDCCCMCLILNPPWVTYQIPHPKSNYCWLAISWVKGPHIWYKIDASPSCHKPSTISLGGTHVRFFIRPAKPPSSLCTLKYVCFSSSLTLAALARRVATWRLTR